MKTSILIIILLLCCNKPLWSQKGLDVLLAQQQIGQLKNGALLVRLKTKKPLIDTLLARGSFNLANRIKNDQKEENLKIVQGAKEKFYFCPVYFFYSDNSNSVKEGNFYGILLNDSLIADSSIHYSGFYLIGEFTYLERDTGKYFSGTSATNQKNQSNTYYGSPYTGFPVFVIKSSDFVQLNRPFPYYVRTYERFFIFKRSRKEIMDRINKQLHDYYSKG